MNIDGVSNNTFVMRSVQLLDMGVARLDTILFVHYWRATGAEFGRRKSHQPVFLCDNAFRHLPLNPRDSCCNYYL